MGCHTWLHKKVDLPLEEAKQKLIQVYQEAITEFTNMSEYNFKTFDMSENYRCKEDLIELFQRFIKCIQKPTIKPETVYRRLSLMGDKVAYYNGESFFEYCEEDFSGNPFRIGDYPDDCLYSLEETLNFIKRYEEQNSCTVEVSMECLKDFWNKYPDGMINFG